MLERQRLYCKDFSEEPIMLTTIMLKYFYCNESFKMLSSKIKFEVKKQDHLCFKLKLYHGHTKTMNGSLCQHSSIL